MEEKRMCLLDETKVCDDCGECNRCDLDPNKICDNCCKCIAMEDEGKEFRSRIVGKEASEAKPFGGYYHISKMKKRDPHVPFDPFDENAELTPELVAFWESKLQEYGEAPADDGFGEISVNTRIPVSGKRKITARHRKQDK
ncbi:MAG: hypothetical protein K6G56_08985 [Clostridiales bacterium]|nr:hypothetical protein [Clostridiales bacterium]